MELKPTLKRIEPFIAIGIFIMLIFIGFNLYKYNNLQNEIADNCGWAEDDVECFCSRSDVIAMKNAAESNLENISIDWENYVYELG